MMNSPVTSTAASEARNSTVVSRGFSSFVLLVFLFWPMSLSHSGARSVAQSGRRPPLSNDSKRAVPPGHLEQMSRLIGEVMSLSPGLGEAGMSWSAFRTDQ